MVSRYSSGVIGRRSRSLDPLKELVSIEIYSCITWNEHRFSETSQLIAMLREWGPRRDEAGALGPMSDNKPPALTGKRSYSVIISWKFSGCSILLLRYIARLLRFTIAIQIFGCWFKWEIFLCLCWNNNIWNEYDGILFVWTKYYISLRGIPNLNWIFII